MSGHSSLKAGVSYKRRIKLNEVLIRFISYPFTLRCNPYVLTTALHIFVAIFYSQGLSLPCESAGGGGCNIRSDSDLGFFCNILPVFCYFGIPVDF